MWSWYAFQQVENVVSVQVSSVKCQISLGGASL